MPKPPPILVGLLLAATLCVDMLALSWLLSRPATSLATVFYDALVVGQLSVVCIWSALRAEKNFWTRIIPLAATLLASGLFALFATPSEWGWVGLPYYGLHAALLLTALWFFTHTRFWRARMGGPAVLRYSLAHLLLAMTIVAVLAAAVANSRFLADEGWLNIVFIAGSVLLATVAAITWSLRLPWLIQLGAVLGLAVLLGGAFAFTNDPFNRLFSVTLGAHYVVQTLVLGAWLSWGAILPAPNAAPEVSRSD